MFLALELTALLVKAPLRYAPASNVKPDVITLVILSHVLTVLRISLHVPPVVLVPLDLLDSGPLLTFEVGPNEPFERAIVFEDLGRATLFVRTNRK